MKRRTVVPLTTQQEWESLLPPLPGPQDRLTLGNLDVQGCSDQSHEGGVEVHCVVIRYRQVHPQESLQKTPGEGSHSWALPASCKPNSPDPPGSPRKNSKAGATPLWSPTPAQNFSFPHPLCPAWSNEGIQGFPHCGLHLAPPHPPFFLKTRSC